MTAPGPFRILEHRFLAREFLYCWAAAGGNSTVDPFFCTISLMRCSALVRASSSMPVDSACVLAVDWRCSTAASRSALEILFHQPLSSAAILKESNVIERIFGAGSDALTRRGLF